jgi:hypothetical protein
LNVIIRHEEQGASHTVLAAAPICQVDAAITVVVHLNIERLDITGKRLGRY